MLAYVWLEAKAQFRNRDAIIWRLGLPAGVYVLLTLVDGETSGSNTGRLVAMAAFGAVAAGLFATGPSLAQDRASGWLRQLRTTPMPTRTVVVAKVAVALAWVLPSIALVAVMSILLTDIELDPRGWTELIGLMWIGSAPFAALGVLIGLAIPDAGAANTATNFAFMVLWLLGGIFTPAGDMPDALAAISRKLPSSGILEIGDSVTRGVAVPASALGLLVAWTAASGVLAALAWRRLGRR
ncbi:MAG: ABC transporter permease [Actinomycetota bacterium]